MRSGSGGAWQQQPSAAAAKPGAGKPLLEPARAKQLTASYLSVPTNKQLLRAMDSMPVSLDFVALLMRHSSVRDALNHVGDTRVSFVGTPELRQTSGCPLAVKEVVLLLRVHHVAAFSLVLTPHPAWTFQKGLRFKPEMIMSIRGYRHVHLMETGMLAVDERLLPFNASAGCNGRSIRHDGSSPKDAGFVAQVDSKLTGILLHSHTLEEGSGCTVLAPTFSSTSDATPMTRETMAAALRLADESEDFTFNPVPRTASFSDEALYRAVIYRMEAMRMRLHEVAKGVAAGTAATWDAVMDGNGVSQWSASHSTLARRLKFDACYKVWSFSRV